MHGQMIQNVKVTCAKSMNCILAPVACVYMYECVGGGGGGGGGGDMWSNSFHPCASVQQVQCVMCARFRPGHSLTHTHTHTHTASSVLINMQ